MKLVQQLDNDAMIKNQLFFINYNFLLFSNFTFFLNDSVNGDQIKQSENRNIYGYNGSYTINHHFGNTKLTTEAGVQLRYDDVNNIELSHTKQRKVILDQLAFGQIDQFNGAVYLDETFRIADKFTINAGVRYDHFLFEYVNDLDTNYNRQVQSKGIASPKLSLFYNATKNLQVYVKGGTGFHSNDTRVVTAQNGQQILPRAFGSDLGVIVKPAKNLLVNAAAWIIDLEQEFVYVGDEAVVEAGGYTRRYGADLSVRYQVLKWLFIDTDVNYTVPRALNVSAEEAYIPLAPTLTSIGGITTIFKNGLQASVRYRMVGDRAANEMNTVTANGYTLLDAVINFKRPKYAIGLSAENLLNTEWNEAQFDTESRLKNETSSVSELHYTPGTPFFVKGSLTYYF
jgi:outer membrane receptor protein involved in Fe transport